jgi:hypothetical protein
MRKAFPLAVVLLFAVALPTVGRGADKPEPVPILIELFTSEGCSSCPPADKWLMQMDSTQPVSGARLIVLSEHVDYWDHDGWRDPYSSHVVTERQSDYALALRLDSPYTPQIVINGTNNISLGNPQQWREALQQAAQASSVAVSLREVRIVAGTPAVLHARVEADGSSVAGSADVYAAVALDHAESQVLRGENGGKRLMHTSVVRQFAKVGKLEKGKPFSRSIELKLEPGVDPKNMRLVVFVQESGPGKVLGAGLQDPIE